MTISTKILNQIVMTSRTLATKLFGKYGDGLASSTTNQQDMADISYDNVMKCDRYGFASHAPSGTLSIIVSIGSGQNLPANITDMVNYDSDNIVSKTSLQETESAIFSGKYARVNRVNKLGYLFKDFSLTPVSGEDVMKIEHAQAVDSKNIETVFNSHTHTITAPIVGALGTITGTGTFNGVAGSFAITVTGFSLTPSPSTPTTAPIQQINLENNNHIQEYTDTKKGLIDDNYAGF